MKIFRPPGGFPQISSFVILDKDETSIVFEKRNNSIRGVIRQIRPLLPAYAGSNNLLYPFENVITDLCRNAIFKETGRAKWSMDGRRHSNNF